MKQFIVLIGILPIMMLFIMQFGLTQINNHMIATAEEYVYAAKETAKQDGYFSEKNISDLKNKIAKVFKVSPDEILVENERVIKYRKNFFDEREMINYRVRIPIKKIMAGARLLGIKDDDNKGYYVISGTVASELLEPES